MKEEERMQVEERLDKARYHLLPLCVVQQRSFSARRPRKSQQGIPGGWL